MPASAAPIRINRAPVLTLWAAVVAERLGHPPETAWSLAGQLAGTIARSKARRLGIAEDKAEPRRPARQGETVTLLGKAIAVVARTDGVRLADDGAGKPAPSGPVQAYVARAFGPRLASPAGRRPVPPSVC